MSSPRFSRARVALVVVLSIVVLVIVGAFAWLPGFVEGKLNPVAKAAPYPVSGPARALHDRLFVADLHADPLLWSRDLSKHGQRGSVDVPRLIEGNVGLQVFGIVTKTPRGQNFESNDDSTDLIRALAFFQRWPMSTWTSLSERVLFQARKLEQVSTNSGGRLTIVRSVDDLEKLIERRRSDRMLVGGLLSVEGAHALEGEVGNVDTFFEAGVRMMSPSHFFDTEMGGSAHGVKKGGLTDGGREMIRRMEELGMVLDLSHASPAAFDEAVALATRPFVVSHTGVRGTCDNVRNLSDDQLRAVAAKDGVVGIAFFAQAVCGVSVKHVVEAIRHAVAVIGVRHVGLGSDYDGAVKVPFDVTGMPLLTAALLDAGLSEDDVALIMGGNVLRLLRATLPKSGAAAGAQ